MVISIIGVGLIGGSMAIDLRKRNFANFIIGVDNSNQHCDEALSLGIVDAILSLKEAVHRSDLIVIAIPVDEAPSVLSEVLDAIDTDTVVIDVGSTKESICKEAFRHKNRGQFVASHPIAGTENTGPSAAHSGLFDGKINIICEKEKSNKKALDAVASVYQCLGMNNIYMEPLEHDKHIAYVSHLSHISSFTLGLTVLNIEKDKRNIFNMAGSGFASTVRLAKSSPDMWTPIFLQNAKNLSMALEEYITELNDFKKVIDEGDKEKLYDLMVNANDIKRVLEGIEIKNEKLKSINDENNGQTFDN